MKIAFKNESRLMRFLGKVLFFNKQFMTRYITTLFDTIYFPNKELFLKNVENSICIVAHEKVHIQQSKKLGGTPLYWAKYLFPQCLALLALLAIPLFFISWQLGVAALTFVFYLAPLPAYWRMKLELEAYQVSLLARAILMEKDGFSKEIIIKVLQNNIEFYDKQFISSAYYYMWPFGAKEKLVKVIDQVQIGDISEDVRQFVLATEAEVNTFYNSLL